MRLDNIGKYERLSVLGHGATGIVYLARDTLLRRLVALKEIDIHAGDVTRFLEEARLLDRLDHPNIVHVNGVDVIDGRVVLDMEYVDGPNLQQMLRTEGCLAQERALSIASQVLQALDYAHRLHVIHRDIKPANILVAAGDVVKLVDFGLAEILATNSYAGGAGTYAYMAPEDFDEERHSDHRSDLWAVGVTLYEMLTGHRPFCPARPKDPFAWRRILLNEDPTPLTRYLPDAPLKLQAVIARALAREKTQRYSTAAEFLHDIQQLVNQEVAPSPDGSSVRTPQSRHISYPNPSFHPQAVVDYRNGVGNAGAVLQSKERAAAHAPVVLRPPILSGSAGSEDAAPTIPEARAPQSASARQGLLQRIGIVRPAVTPPLTIEADPPAITVAGVRKGEERTARIRVRLRNGRRRAMARVTGAPPWVTVRPLVLDRRAQTLMITINSGLVWEPGEYHDAIRIEGDGASVTIPIQIGVLPPRRTFGQAAVWWIPLFACALMPAAFVGLLAHAATAAYLVPAALLASGLLLGMLLLVSIAADLGANERYACGAMMALMLMMLGAMSVAHGEFVASPSSMAGVGIPIGMMLLVQVFSPQRWKFWAVAVPILAMVTCSSFVNALSQ
ncbi:MAG: serine/threonine-protein kinase [Chthonomonadales bacterium]